MLRVGRAMAAGGVAWGLGAWPGWVGAQQRPQVEIWKGPSCECCHDWMAHLRRHGLDIGPVHDEGNTEARQRLGIPLRLGSCHTGWVMGYALEGHVPAEDVWRLLRERPDAAGLAVPGMPVGSPGMDGAAYQGRRDPFAVLLVDRQGRTRVWRQVG
ncbi:DUF411 domain-containing protein [Ideonella sp. TBM-1]|uniref:DUF411 domain-containing protein n=2 Tax=Ideonella livida TaxID=2707176 RepID=A0A7C9TH49_9BURK|nr:DUF411 domain-containing protein [Ideonella livida]